MIDKNVGVCHFSTESYQMDFLGQFPLSAIGNYLLHTASFHAAKHGFGYDEMTGNNTAWVLSRIAIEMFEHPLQLNGLNIYTWVTDVNKFFTNRCFEITDSTDKTLGYAHSIWAAIDMETRRPTLLNIEKLKDVFSNRACPIEKPGKIIAAETDDALYEPYKVKYSDIDINGHLNSIKYIEHLLNLFDLDMFRNNYISRFEISYISEGHFGMDLMLYKKALENNKYSLSICHEGKAICRASVTWTKSNNK